ncbi:hypothetical protein BDR26DRAFT_1012220 [Obelidium mucronatum]|nr:hypothetical protein BDR26DRAFT_1012220 [Obelidium mucronatum]
MLPHEQEQLLQEMNIRIESLESRMEGLTDRVGHLKNTTATATDPASCTTTTTTTATATTSIIAIDPFSLDSAISESQKWLDGFLAQLVSLSSNTAFPTTKTTTMNPQAGQSSFAVTDTRKTDLQCTTVSSNPTTSFVKPQTERHSRDRRNRDPDNQQQRPSKRQRENIKSYSSSNNNSSSSSKASEICSLFQDNRCAKIHKSSIAHVCMLCDIPDARHSLRDCPRAAMLYWKLDYCLFWNKGWCRSKICEKTHLCLKCDSNRHGSNACSC